MQFQETKQLYGVKYQFPGFINTRTWNNIDRKELENQSARKFKDPTIQANI